MENTRTDVASQGALPTFGRFTAARWAAFLDIDVKTLFANVAKNEIRVIRFGRLMIIDVAWFWEDLQKSLSNEEEPE